MEGDREEIKATDEKYLIDSFGDEQCSHASCSYIHSIRAQSLVRQKTGQVGHLSEQRHVWSVMLLCNYQSSTTALEMN